MTSNGQSKKEFDDYGKLMLGQLSRERFDSIPLIRLREYREFLTERISDETKLKGEIYKVDAAYLDFYRIYQNSMFDLVKSFRIAKKRGAQFTYSEFFIETSEGLKDTYHGDLVYLYTQSDIQTEVNLSFDFAWHNGYFVLMGPVKEDF